MVISLPMTEIPFPKSGEALSVTQRTNGRYTWWAVVLSLPLYQRGRRTECEAAYYLGKDGGLAAPSARPYRNFAQSLD
ncbi:hypothetical protein [Bradyrhizobium iriomotense]|uniref:hypothetical protein n=1 Tax=Bradyrhizobium iriomotense TaxID=441950 RepID=UPI0024E1197F|nr:hypothetical protein [Bradyrhizobium iriomotense]